MREINESDKACIVDLIARLSPDAGDFARNRMGETGAKVYYHDQTPHRQGVYCLICQGEAYYAYASFMQDVDDAGLLHLIESTIRPYMENKAQLCFNVYGKNTNIIKLVKSLGFITDMEGYEFAYQGAVPPEIPFTNLAVRPFAQSSLEEFMQLFEQAYYELNVNNGWAVDWLVIQPKFQRSGYGRLLLLHATRSLLERNVAQRVCLRVAKSNQGAIRFYQRNLFDEIACFAEHTFQKKLLTSC